MSHISVVSPGLLTTVQDLGRWGLQSRGVPVSGPMDLFSHRLSNALVGNAADLAALEVTLLGPELEFGDGRTVAVVGAAFELTLDGRAVQMHVPFDVTSGSRLKFGERKNGARAYVAVRGGISVPTVLGSRSTHVTTGLGGLDGRALKTGDRIPLGAQNPDTRSHRGARRETADPVVPTGLRVLPGLQFDAFPADAHRVLHASSYTVDHHSDRMAFRLLGPTLDRTAAGEMISDATPMGTIQVLPTGLPLLLMADRQTTGGYPQIATVISADLHLAAQLAPGDALTFRACTPAEAMAALIAQERVLLDAENR